jgi:23S rRNA G2445 N2-methylase RlmL
VRNLESQLPFEYWPIHQKDQYAQYREELSDFSKMLKRREIDLQIIGSDISQKAIETTVKNIGYSEV